MSDEPSQLDRIETMLIRLTHIPVVQRGYSGEFTASCWCGWTAGWHYNGPGSGPPLRPDVEVQKHLDSLIPRR